MRLFEECDDGTLAAKADQIQNLLCHLIDDFEVAFICLDALDECSPDTKTELLSFIYVVIGRCDNVKIIVSSRSGDSEVSEYLDSCPSITITPHVIARDIDLYVRRRIDQGTLCDWLGPNTWSTNSRPEPKECMDNNFNVCIVHLANNDRFLWVSC